MEGQSKAHIKQVPHNEPEDIQRIQRQKDQERTERPELYPGKARKHGHHCEHEHTFVIMPVTNSELYRNKGTYDKSDLPWN